MNNFEKWKSAISFRKNAGAMFFYLTEVEGWSNSTARKAIRIPLRKETNAGYYPRSRIYDRWYSNERKTEYHPCTLWKTIFVFAKKRNEWFRVKDFTHSGHYRGCQRLILDHMHMYMDFLRLVWCGVLDVKLDDDKDINRRVMYFKLAKNAQLTLDTYHKKPIGMSRSGKERGCPPALHQINRNLSTS